MERLLQKKVLIPLLVITVFALFLYGVKSILLPFILSFVFAYFLYPLYQRVEKRIKNQTLSVSVVVVGFCLFFVFILLLVLPILAVQLRAFAIKIPQYFSSVLIQLEKFLEKVKELYPSFEWQDYLTNFSQYLKGGLTYVTDILLGFISNGVVFFNFVSLLLIVPVVIFYLLLDWNIITKTIFDFIPKRYQKTSKEIFKEIDDRLSGFIRGQIAVCGVLAIFYAVALSAVGLDLGLLIGLLIGILSFIPYMGFLLGMVLSALVALLQGASLSLWIALGIVFIVGQIVESWFVTPYFLGKRIGLNPVWIIFSLLAGGALCGFMGVLIAVPVASVLGVLLRHGFQKYKKTDFYEKSS